MFTRMIPQDEYNYVRCIDQKDAFPIYVAWPGEFDFGDQTMQSRIEERIKWYESHYHIESYRLFIFDSAPDPEKGWEFEGAYWRACVHRLELDKFAKQI